MCILSNDLSLKDGIWLIWSPTERIFDPVNHNRESAIATRHLEFWWRILLTFKILKSTRFVKLRNNLIRGLIFSEASLSDLFCEHVTPSLKDKTKIVFLTLLGSWPGFAEMSFNELRFGGVFWEDSELGGRFRSLAENGGFEMSDKNQLASRLMFSVISPERSPNDGTRQKTHLSRRRSSLASLIRTPDKVRSVPFVRCLFNLKICNYVYSAISAGDWCRDGASDKAICRWPPKMAQNPEN